MNTNQTLDDFLSRYEHDDASRIHDARSWARQVFAGRLRASGEPEWEHGERVAAILASMGMGYETIIASLAHHALELMTLAELSSIFGSRCAALVDGVRGLSALKARNKTLQAADTMRKMIFAMAGDLRVIIIRLADKLDSMRTLRALPQENRARIAAETLDIYAPLADRLGISWLKDELEDLSLKEINREAYDQIKLLVAGKKTEREEFLNTVCRQLSDSAQADGIAVETSHRAKHFYSIYQKMRKRAKASDEMFDLYGIRVFCQAEQDCYAVLGIAHRLWKPMDGRFKDYIAMPKTNGYRSLHTTVLASGGKPLEIQIRTHEMHKQAEFGIASHWLYKKGKSSELVRKEDLPLVNRLKDWAALLDSGEDFLADIKREFLGDSIFVFTPQGDSIQLPAGATPLDFAFAIHTDLGLRCLSAKANGAIVPLSAELSNTQVVEIQTGSNARPNINWLKAVKTSKARSRIRQYLLSQDQVLAIDKNIVAKAEARSEEKLTAAVKATGQDAGTKGVLDFHARVSDRATDSEAAGLAIAGAGKLLVRFAACCKPHPGDRIVGYVSRGRGIIVHRDDCHNLPGISEFAQRKVDVSWETSPGLVRRYRVLARSSLDLFSEIEHAAKKHGGTLVEGKLERSSEGLSGSFTMAFAETKDARIVERNLRQVPNILRIRRAD
ncbi:MAG TPA: RelA/SpoT family protein [Spirochaetales bacterium]|nr:RelA/SpoT family protein [Spirochaetales bacterium]